MIFPSIKNTYCAPGDIPGDIYAEGAYTAVSGNCLYRCPLKFKVEMIAMLESLGLPIDRES